MEVEGDAVRVLATYFNLVCSLDWLNLPCRCVRAGVFLSGTVKISNRFAGAVQVELGLDVAYIILCTVVLAFDERPFLTQVRSVALAVGIVVSICVWSAPVILDADVRKLGIGIIDDIIRIFQVISGLQTSRKATDQE